ncbi:hypothetical protein F9643_003171 [Escherichia coli]|uniref:hypothetical protein n=1 Tax=Escherichia coli TaxID=562 RepID=UPI000BDE8770|nr:hypothetical protein [Escherichia coli]EER0916728.1 hypothetical protein [Escherichia coli O168:H8]EES8553817.1 hypothetical protein [Escherichia coli O168]MVW44806.1 hypothetical protein [Enterobacteriaceae bacterium TzEc013]EER0947498.1 hypothetical protein [Escherichia coli O168:H8]EER2485495.1 hypothetical protein [Escherichia coli]
MCKQKTVRNIMALAGLVLMFAGILAAGLSVLLFVYHWTVGSPVYPWLYTLGGSALCAMLAGSFLMEYGGIQPHPDRR